MANFSGLAAAIGASMLIGLSGCASTLPRIQQLPTKDQAASRRYQTRAFDTADAEKTLRVVISTLQDFDFIIEEANSVLGVVNAVKPDDGLQINVTVRPKDETQVLVQAIMNYNHKAVGDPSEYRKFFAQLEKSMFLTARAVD